MTTKILMPGDKLSLDVYPPGAPGPDDYTRDELVKIWADSLRESGYVPLTDDPEVRRHVTIEETEGSERRTLPYVRERYLRRVRYEVIGEARNAGEVEVNEKRSWWR